MLLWSLMERDGREDVYRHPNRSPRWGQGVRTGYLGFEIHGQQPWEATDDPMAPGTVHWVGEV